MLAFATLYRDFLTAVIASELGEDPAPHLRLLPSVADGTSTLLLAEAAVASHEQAGIMVPLAR